MALNEKILPWRMMIDDLMIESFNMIHALLSFINTLYSGRQKILTSFMAIKLIYF